MAKTAALEGGGGGGDAEVTFWEITPLAAFRTAHRPHQMAYRRKPASIV